MNLLILSLALTGCGGKDGAAGATGATGAAGATGASGSAGITSATKLYCSKIDAGTGASFLYKYRSVVFSNGDRFVSCSVSGSNAGYGSSDYFKSSQNGATTGGCTVEADLDTASSGFWSFTSQSGTSKVVYTDSGSTHDGYTYTFVTADCSTI
jgi:hypothetical protein